jgi:hypothetical protein
MSASLSLHLGLNYPRTANELNGCQNDAQDWSDAMRARGYRDTTLLEPPRQTIIAAIQSLVAVARWGDRLVITYSGHGTWVPDGSGDEPDGRDEAWCPADFRTAGVLTDDTLYELFSLLRTGVRCLVISDSCYSGSVTRSLVTVEGALGRPRFIPPAEVAHHDGTEMTRLLAAESLPSKGTPRPSRNVLVSGCSDTEVSYDANIDGRPRGAASWALLTALAELSPTGQPVHLKPWQSRAQQLLDGRGYDQHPVLDGSYYRRTVWTA